jgi:hypothetical protein
VADFFNRVSLLLVTDSNWPSWCETAFELINQYQNSMTIINSIILDTLLKHEKELAEHYRQNTHPHTAPASGSCPDDYPTLMPGEEHKLQHKLDLWNRFQLAHGLGPALLRLLLSMGIVGSTLVSGLSIHFTM